ncbi:GTP-binding protein HSR1-related protein [Thalassoporum mexicanum PCC 7367]|nr:GTP-binding protein HSR1-related protein [Pseudanabaena sp. PCC 7367]
MDYVELASDRLEQYLAQTAGKLTELEITRLKSLQAKLKTRTIEIAAFGLVSRGKTALLNALAGKKIGATGATHGTTQAIATESWADIGKAAIEPISNVPDSNVPDSNVPDSNVPDINSLDIDSSAKLANNFAPAAPSTSQGEKPTEPAIIQSDRSYIVQYSHKARLKLVDTPGLDEIDGEARAEMAIAAAKQADLILFVVAGDLNRTEYEALKLLKQTGKPLLLVFNKVDLYATADQQAILASLQRAASELGIATEEIILAAAEPMPMRVRIQYAGGTDPADSVDAIEIVEKYEQPMPQIEPLKKHLLDLLNQSGRALLAINVLQQLREIQITLSDRHIQDLPTPRTLASISFVIKVITLAILPTFELDVLASAAIDSCLILAWVWGYPLPRVGWWGIAIVLNAIISAGWAIEAELTQIVWIGATMPAMLTLLQRELQAGAAGGKLGAASLLAKIHQETANAPT